MRIRLAIIIASGMVLAGTACTIVGQQASQSGQQTQSGQDSVAAAARKAREQKKAQPPTGKTYSNDDVGSLGGTVSTVGAAPDEKKADAASAADKNAEPADNAKDEKYWRKRFADLRQKIASTQQEIDVLQRELNTAQTQYYPDPNEALQQQHSRDEINKKTEAIDKKKKELDALNQQLSDLEDELRRAGGDPGWAR